MVNENYGHGRIRIRSRSDGAGYRLRPNPAAAHLAVRDHITRNYVDPAARAEHPRGVILRIDGGVALVRWTRELTDEHIELKWLVKTAS